MATVRIGETEVYYEVHGRGDPLVLLHHGTGCAAMWEGLRPALAEHYRVISYDRRGFGRSEPGEGFQEYYLGGGYCGESVNELCAVLAHAGVGGRIRMIGQCEGGAVAFHYAARYPDRVDAVVASSTLCSSGVTVGELCRGKMFASFETADPGFQEKMKRWHGPARAPELYALFLRMGGAYGDGVFDLRGVLRGVTCPSLVLYPDRSGLFDVEQGLLMYRALPAGELAVLPGCGHNTYAQQPEEYLRHVLSFFERHR